MRHRNRGRKLNRNAQHRNSLMRNLARALFLSPKGRIVTTLTKAKEVRPFVEKLVTLGRYGDETSRRRAVAMLGHHDRPILDSATLAYLARTYFRGRTPSSSQVERRLARYGRWKGRVMWFDYWLGRKEP